MQGIFGMCCVNRQKDELNDSRLSNSPLQANFPADFIKARPALTSVLNWFEEIETSWRRGLQLQPPLLQTIDHLRREAAETEIKVAENQY